MAVTVKTYTWQNKIPVAKKCLHCGALCSEDVKLKLVTNYNSDPFAQMNLEPYIKKITERIDVAALCSECDRFSPEFEEYFFKKGPREYLKGPSAIMAALGNSILIAIVGLGLFYFFSNNVTRIIGIGLLCLSPIVLIAKWYDKRSFAQKIESFSDEVVHGILLQEYKIFSRQPFFADLGVKHLHRKNPFCRDWHKRQPKKDS